jgi:hypothetical protein
MNSKFFAYRFFVLPIEQQITLQQLSISSKEELIVRFFNLLRVEKKIAYTYKNKHHILYLTKELADGIFLCKLAKQKKITLYEPGSFDIEDSPENTYPYIYIVADIHSQILFIQSNKSVFSNRETAINSFCRLINEHIEEYDYIVTADEITYEQNFWEELDKHNAIYELELTMKSPNLFGGLVEAEALLKEVNKIYNNTETTIKVKNDKGKLKIIKDKINSFIKYIAAGGGKWVLGVPGKGRKKIEKIESTQSIRTIQLNVIEDNVELEVILNEIKTINEIINISNNEASSNLEED